MLTWRPAVNLLLFSFAFGGSVFYSYIAAPIASKVLTRDQFSDLQQNVFPLFFKMETFTPILLAVTSPVALSAVSKASIATAAASGGLNLFWFFPWAHRVNQERRHAAASLKGEELEEVDAPLRKEFAKAHGLSMFANLTYVLGMTVYGVAFSYGLFRYIPK
ncbi:HBL091Wp [Eremothecium sinecaudum]|uniref:HBL091Wp n=1 Tax=Eremothecium sinecaudum TaxID=45286 RepID=A0A120K0Z2_9SACH|nr:HBL091Wp [Eremothecium sinecaudum]AMD18811.1 HBL091Wp [Eremothecium sinecaudum]